MLVALEKFKADQGGYPERLHELAPDYLPEVPRPSIGLGVNRVIFQVHDSKEKPGVTLASCITYFSERS